MTSQFKFDKRLNYSYLDEIYENDTEHAAIIFDQFLITLPNQLKEIEAEYSLANLRDFRQKIHKVKPTFSFVGLTNLTDKAAQIEKRCDEAVEIGNINDLYLDFKHSIDEYLPIVKEEFARLQLK